MRLNIFVVLGLLSLLSCSSNAVEQQKLSNKTLSTSAPLKLGAERIDVYLPKIKGKSIALVVNQTSRVGERHLVDTLLSLGVSIKAIFAPEHGFRGEASAGEKIKDGKDPKTGISLISLYGKKKAPSKEDLRGVDQIIFDIQDVGARFYTYISTMHYVMASCAQFKVPMLVLDRPNPNGHYVDGPILKSEFQSFVGMHAVPVVHGMTIGEYAKMVNGEGWLPQGAKCALQVIPCENYLHNDFYDLPIKPSPNLPNALAVHLYPSLCFFEGTEVSAGRGTNKQFQIYGHPKGEGSFSFTPKSMPGAKYPKHEGKVCLGEDLQERSLEAIRSERRLNLSYLLDYYQSFPNKDQFFLKNNFFEKLAGTDELRKQIIAGVSEEEIRESWVAGVNKFKKIRERYLLYP